MSTDAAIELDTLPALSRSPPVGSLRPLNDAAPATPLRSASVAPLHSRNVSVSTSVSWSQSSGSSSTDVATPTDSASRRMTPARRHTLSEQVWRGFW